MRIILYFILLSISCAFISCSKGSVINDPHFGQIAFSNSSTFAIDIIQGDQAVVSANGTATSIIAGRNRFRFYQNKQLLLDTSLTVEAYQLHTYTLFKSAAGSRLAVYDADLNGLKNEVLPDSGYVKLAVANFSSSLPDKINITISTTTYTPNSDKPIVVGQILNVERSFSEFHQLLLGVNQFGKVVNTFTLTITDPDNKAVLASLPLVLPKNTTGFLDNLTGSVYLFYLSSDNSPVILMNK